MFTAILLAMLSCSKDSNNDQEIIPPPDIWDNFFGFEVNDPENLLCPYLNRHSDTTKTIISGSRNNLIWIGIFDNATKKLLKEYTDKNPISLQQKVYLGYGEYQEYTVVGIAVEVIEKEEGVVYLANLHSSGLSTFNRILSYIGKNGECKRVNDFDAGINLYNWFGEYVILKKKSTSIMSVPFICYSASLDSIYEVSNKYYQNGALHSVNYKDRIPNSIPISLEEGLFFEDNMSWRENTHIDAFNAVVRVNFKTGNLIWASKINNDLPNNARAERTVVSVKDDIYLVQFNITYYNGQKEVRRFNINATSGEVVRVD